MAWTQPVRLQTGPIIAHASAAWHDSQVFDECIIVDPFDATKAVMMFSGMAAPIQVGMQAIGRATAPLSDLTNWTEDAGNPRIVRGGVGQWDHTAAGIRCDSVVLVGTDMWLYYTGDPLSNDGSTTGCGLAISSDSGVNWTKYASNPVLTPAMGATDETCVSQMAVYREDATHWHALYSYRTATVALPGLRYASSSDGMTWTKNNAGDVLTQGPPGSPSARFMEFHRLFKYSDGFYYVTWEAGYSAGGLGGPYQTFGARSQLVPSGWVKMTGAAYPVFSPSFVPGRYDEFHVGSGAMYQLGSQWYFGFCGGTPADLTATAWSLGLATLGSETPASTFDPITTFVFNAGMSGLSSGGSITWGTSGSGDTIKARLVDSAAVPDIDATDMVGLLAVGTDVTLTGKGKSTDTATNRVSYTASNLIYTGLTGNEVSSLVIYKFVTDDAGSTPIACLALTPFTPDGSDQAVDFSSSGVFYTQQ